MMAIRDLLPADWDSVAQIYGEGIASGLATFETSVPTWDDFHASRLASPRLVASEGETILGWAALSPISKRACYAGVTEFSIYLASTAKGRGIGSALLAELIARSEREGIWTLQGSIFPENTASIRLVEKFGFRYVGRRERIAWHRGAWRDTVIYERRSAIVEAPIEELTTA